MKRGDIVTVALSGDYGKPRPALIVQTDQLDTTSTIVVLLLTSTLSDSPLVRQTVQPSKENGLRVTSQVQVDKFYSVKRIKVGPPIGHLEGETMARVTRLMAAILGLAETRPAAPPPSPPDRRS